MRKNDHQQSIQRDKREKDEIIDNNDYFHSSFIKHFLGKWTGLSFLGKKLAKSKFKEKKKDNQEKEEMDENEERRKLSLSLSSRSDSDLESIPIKINSLSVKEAADNDNDDIITFSKIDSAFKSTLAVTSACTSSPPNVSFPPFRNKKGENNFIIERTIGIGSFSRVKLLKNIQNNELYAVKLIDFNILHQTTSISNQLEREAEILKILQSNPHLNIVKFYCMMEFEHSLGLVMEFIEGGELFNLLIERKKLDESETKLLVGQLLDSIDHLHQLGIVHRDIKLENILLDYKTRPSMVTLKLIDFGLAKYTCHSQSISCHFKSEIENEKMIIDSIERNKEIANNRLEMTREKSIMLNTRCGSEEYAAPEILFGKFPYNGIMSDAWSVGVVTFACLFGSMPFGNGGDGTSTDNNKYSDRSLSEQIIEGLYNIPNGIVSMEAVDFIKKLLTIDPLKRMSIKEAKRHAWLTN